MKYIPSLTRLEDPQGVYAHVWAKHTKKRYPSHFVAKITDCDMENSETGIWLDFALACKYINEEMHKKLVEENAEVGRLLNHMLNNPERY